MHVVAAIAALAASAPSTARADWMLGGYLGHAATLSSTVTLSLPGRQTEIRAEGVTYRGRSFEFPLYYGYRVMWLPNDASTIGVEYEFIHAKVYAETDGVVRLRGTLRGAPVDAALPLSSVARRLDMSHGLNFFLANVVVRRPFGPSASGGSPRFVAVARAGAGPTLPHAESTIDGVDREQYEAGGLGVQAAGGLEVALWRGLAAVGEYKWTWAKPTIEITGGQATIPSGSHHAAVGVGYRF
jgi:opacity protein-like surface antigen